MLKRLLYVFWVICYFKLIGDYLVSTYPPGQIVDYFGCYFGIPMLLAITLFGIILLIKWIITGKI